MSLWTRIGEALSALAAGESLSDVFDKLRADPEKTVAFAIATIALGAKMAKADGLVTRDEVTAFREVFHIPKADEASAARVFNLARQDVAGFEDYARRVARMFKDGDMALCDLLEGLFHIAGADGTSSIVLVRYLAFLSASFARSARVLFPMPSPIPTMCLVLIPTCRWKTSGRHGGLPSVRVTQIA